MKRAKRSHSITLYIVIAITFVLFISVLMAVSEAVLSKMQKDETDKLESSIDKMNAYMLSIEEFLTSYSRFLIDRDSVYSSKLHRYWNEMTKIHNENPNVFKATEKLNLYSRVIAQTSDSMVKIVDEKLLNPLLRESDFDLIQRAELGIDYIYQAANAMSAEYFTYESHEFSRISVKYDNYSLIQGSILVICLLLEILWSAWIYCSFIRGLTIINDGTKRISQKEWNIPDLPMTSITELNNVIEATNLMKKAIVDYISAIEEHMRLNELLAEKTLETERQKRLIQETQFNLLQAQINPHFLFNTLNMIVNNVRAGERLEETANVLVSTSKLLRSSIELKSPVIMLNEELKLLDNYITIQKARNEDRILFCIIVIGDVPDVEIPPFSLQPLIENSIIHGLKDVVSDGYVEIEIFSDEDNGAMIQIHDNGIGIPEDIEKAAIDGTLSTNGLGNVIKRLKMIYSNGDLIRFSKAGGGSTTIIHLNSNSKKGVEC